MKWIRRIVSIENQPSIAKVGSGLPVIAENPGSPIYKPVQNKAVTLSTIVQWNMRSHKLNTTYAFLSVCINISPPPFIYTMHLY